MRPVTAMNMAAAMLAISMAGGSFRRADDDLIEPKGERPQRLIPRPAAQPMTSNRAPADLAAIDQAARKRARKAARQGRGMKRGQT